MKITTNYLKSVIQEFNRYKVLGDKTFSQINEEDILWSPTGDDTNISQIVKHMVGNMHSRWTNFLTEDGEKKWRDRENEFVNPFASKKEMILAWNEGWQCLFNALNQLNEDNFSTTIKIRNEEHTPIEAINRQLAHYANHVGQIILLGKLKRGESWTSLSIPKGKSDEFNAKKFSTEGDSYTGTI